MAGVVKTRPAKVLKISFVDHFIFFKSHQDRLEEDITALCCLKNFMLFIGQTNGGGYLSASERVMDRPFCVFGLLNFRNLCAVLKNGGMMTNILKKLLSRPIRAFKNTVTV